MSLSSGLVVENVSKKFCRHLRRSLAYGARDIVGELAWWKAADAAVLREAEFWAVRDITFTLRPGEALGIVGENGAGKSTLLKLMAGLLKPDSGSIRVQGRTCAMDLGAGMLPQLTGRENIYAQAAMLGHVPWAIREQVDSIIAFAELEDFIDTTVGFYSTGMRTRLAFAIAAHADPAILLVDEILAVGDLGFQRKCLQHISRFLQGGGILVLVSHSVPQIQAICQRGLVMEHGKAVYAGTAVNALDFYLQRKTLQDTSPTASAVAPETGPPASARPTDRDPVRIDRIRIEPLEGPGLQTGKRARILVSYTSMGRFERVRWSFVIYNQDQSVCITGALRPEPQPLAEGEGTFGCIVPSLPLANGTYVLKVGISDAERAMPLAQSGWLDSPQTFQVSNDADPVNNMGIVLNTLVTLTVDWEEPRAC